MKKTIPLLVALLSASFLPHASAALIDPTYDQFGALPVATFSGSGIPNTAVAITTEGSLTLGLSAAARYDNVPVTNDGAGNFFADLGNDAAHGQPGYARWNFNFYIGGLETGTRVDLYADINPAAGNDVPVHPFVTFTSDTQNSWNLGMWFLNGGTFNPSVAGEYDFALVAVNISSGTEIARSAISVHVPGVPDQGATIGLLGLAMTGLVVLRRRAGSK